MRFWLDPKGDMVDDQRLLAYIAAHGSLSEALKSGDFKLLADTGHHDCFPARAAGKNPKERRLVDYLS